MNAPPATDTPPRAAPLALWRVAQAFLNTLYNLFGAPEDVAAKHTLLREAHARMASWLRCAEALLRRLLLIEAAALAAAPLARKAVGKMPAARVRRAMSFDADKPEAWRVSFRCFNAADLRARGPRPMRQSDPRRAAMARFRSAWPLAERYEALIRVFNAPAAYARRLARRLFANAKMVGAVLRAPEEAEHRIDQYERFEAACAIASARFLNSS